MKGAPGGLQPKVGSKHAANEPLRTREKRANHENLVEKARAPLQFYQKLRDRDTLFGGSVTRSRPTASK